MTSTYAGSGYRIATTRDGLCSDGNTAFPQSLGRQ
jgi:hypothetical protein